MAAVEKIYDQDVLQALVIRKNFDKEGLNFLTEDSRAFQLGIQNQKKGYFSAPHKHIPFKKLENLNVEELFYVIEGKLIVGLYKDNKEKIRDVELLPGDLIILYQSHSNYCDKDTKFIELKQGPYRGKDNEKRFL